MNYPICNLKSFEETSEQDVFLLRIVSDEKKLKMAEENKYPLDYERRFGGVAKLYTKDGAERLRNAHVCVVGLGGVGSWAAEALARTAVGRITLVDLDNVAESNTNRQLQAMTGVYGKPKVIRNRSPGFTLFP